MKKLFSQLHQKLCSIYEKPPQGNALKRITTLSGLIAGMIRKGSSNLPDIGSGLPQNIDANSKTVAAKRFVNNKWTDYETHYLPFIVEFLRAIIAFTPVGDSLPIAIDGSQMGKHHAALMVSVVWQNRGIPICWFVKRGSKGHFTEENHVEVLSHTAQILKPLLPPGMSAIVLGDGEFDGINLQTFCNNCGWQYVLRTACDTVLYENGERFQARQAAPQFEQNCSFIPQVEFTEKRFRYVNFLCWHDKKRYEKPIFLVSSLSEAGDIMEYYDQRYSIECLFKDLKSTSFNLHKTRLKKACDISNLIIIAALAFIMLLSLGIMHEHSPLRKKVQRVRHDRKVLSIFSFANRLLDYLIDNDIGFNFSFQFSKNCS